MKKIVIAIDGPAASGKSTTAKLVAERLGYLFVDTGAMYRAVTLKVLEKGIDPKDSDAIARLLEKTEVKLELNNGRLKLLLDGVDVTNKIRKPEITRAVSTVSSIKKVREAMVREQRRMGEQGGIVLEGRDIGTVVFPNADLKIFMVANVRERAKRRQKDLAEQGTKVDLQELIHEIEERDKRDSTREASPLKRAPDAIELDNSELTLEQQADFIVEKALKLIQTKRIS